MQTDSQEYQQYLVTKYRRGRTLYLRLCVYPKYFRALGDLRGQTVFDLGCGNGEFLKECARRGIAAHGVDSNEHLLKLCRDAGLQATVADVLAFKPPDPGICKAVCDNVLEHLTVAEIECFLANLRQTVCKGGTVLIVVPGKKGFASDPTHKTFISAEFMRETCGKQDIRIQDSFCLPINWQIVGNFFYLNMRLFSLQF